MTKKNVYIRYTLYNTLHVPDVTKIEAKKKSIDRGIRDRYIS